MEPADSETLTMVRTVQPSDFETMERLKVVQPSESELMRRLLNPAVDAFYHQGKFVGIDSPETRFLDEWKRLERQLIIRESEARYWALALYMRFACYKDWFPRLGDGEVGDLKLCWSREQQHICEGLTAAATLFATEAFNSIEFRRAEEFPQFKECPKDTFKVGELACSFQDWHQGFTLALLHFGAATIDDKFVQETVRAYPADIAFFKRYMKVAEHGSRSLLSILCRFARDWDTFVIPLRYFTQAAALNFVAERYHHFEDSARFRTVFFKGGNSKQCPGLKLTRAKPSIVHMWSKGVIKLNAPAAAAHGYNAARLAKVLRERYDRPVSV